MTNPIPFIDPHVHADSRSAEEFPRLCAAGCVGLVAVAGPSGGFRSSDSLLDHFRRLGRVDRLRIEGGGLQAWLALGIHPMALPETGLDEALDALPGALREYRAVAVGEIGLESGSADEARALERCFAVAAMLGLPAIVHTPRTGKAERLDQTLEILARTSLPEDRVLLDHLDRSVLDRALRTNCYLGLSVHPVKLSPAEAAAIVADHGAGHFVLDTDMGANPSHLFGIPASIAAMYELDVPPEVIRAVVRDHAAELLGVCP